MTPPKYRPWIAAAASFQIGLKPSDPATWIDVTDGYAAFMAEKRQRLDGLPPLYYRTLPESLPAQEELRDLIVAHLLAQHGQHFTRRGDHLHCAIDDMVHAINKGEPLAAISMAIEEDFMLLKPGDGKVTITAASNAYTTSGRIVSSVGHPMQWAHEHVPKLNDQLGPRVDRVLANIKPGQPVERFNWAITPIATLFFPDSPHEANVAAAGKIAEDLSRDPSNCGAQLWLRAERQILVRLPQTGAIAFSLHTYSDPLQSLSEDPESLTAIAALLTGYDEDRLRYSAMTELRAPVLEWIEQQTACITEPA
ncbi:heme-dependent oxidative N-demethylase family protein [Aestuariivirga sp.]|uniref:heme-dependent oxidative N-demethylase family protein n=1 Tax=Aestuariivirga sp. TaxID=2650926 RepID=UPI0039E347ED